MGWTRISRANSPNRASLRSAITHPNPSRREEACITPMPPSPARSSCSYRAAFHAVPSAQPSPCRSEEHTSELQSLMRISYAVFCLKKKIQNTTTTTKYKQKHNKHKVHNLY